MSLQSADGENGFPGEVDVNVTYRLTDGNRLVIKYTARTRHKPTPISLSSRLLFNLAGNAARNIAFGATAPTKIRLFHERRKQLPPSALQRAA